MMLRNVSRRLDRIELAIPLPVTRERFVARVRQQMQRTGAGLEAAIATLLRDLSDSELASLGAEVEQVMFGSDIAARDAAKRKVLMDFYPGQVFDAGTMGSLCLSVASDLSKLDSSTEVR